jgi:hypothetical protein
MLQEMNANRFALLTLIAAPAVMTNASSVLALGSANRLARAVDRARELARQISAGSGDEAMLKAARRQMERAEFRAKLLLRAMTSFYFAVGSFAATSLISLFGAALSSSNLVWAYRLTTILAITAGSAGVIGVVIGSSVLVRETRIAVTNLRDEAAALGLHL